MNIKQFEECLSKKQALEIILQNKEHYCLKGGLAYEIAGKIEKMSQLRNFFDPIDKIHQEVKIKKPNEAFDAVFMNKLLPLHFELANRVAREVIKKEFYQIMSAIMTKETLKANKDFMIFHELLTAVIAYKNYRDKVKEDDKGGNK